MHKNIGFIFTFLFVSVTSLIGLLIWKPIPIFIIPGILILFLPIFKKIDFINVFIYIIGTSLIFWICSFWFLKFIPIHLTTYFFLVTGVVVLLIIYFLIKKIRPYPISLKFHNFILILLFLFILFLRLIPLNNVITSAGIDMPKHDYLTNLIVEANGVPQNYYPIFNIDNFFSFAVGFHTISALISLLANIPAYKSIFIMTSLTFFLLTSFLFVFLRHYVSWIYAFISSIAFTFFTHNPQFYVQWGGIPTIFTLAFFILFLSFLNIIQSKNIWLIILISLSLAAVFLSHTVIFISVVYIFGIPFFIYSLIKQEYKNLRWIKYLKVVVFFFIIISPFLINLDYSEIVHPERIQWLKDSIMNEEAAKSINITNFIWTIPYYIGYIIFLKANFFFFLATFFIFFGMVYFLIKDPKNTIMYILFLLLLVLVILNVKYWILPFSYVMEAWRVAIISIIPFSLFFAVSLSYFGNKILNFFNRIILNRKKLYVLFIILLITPTLMLAVKYNKEKYTNHIINFSSVTKEDLQALNWLMKITNESEVIQNNRGDAGAWIPSIISRPVINTAPVLPLPFPLTKPKEPKYIYIGKKCIKDLDCPLKNLNFIDDDRYELIYSKGGVYIYKIK